MSIVITLYLVAVVAFGLGVLAGGDRLPRRHAERGR